MPKTNDVLFNPAIQAAVTQAAYQTLISLYPAQKVLFDKAQSGFLNTLRKDLLAQLATSEDKITYTPIMEPGYHQPDPTHPNQSFLSPQKNTVQQNARLFALVNYAMADAAIAAWDSKYYYGFWRPIVAIRRGTRSTRSIPNWLPLGAASDGSGTNFTPAFPSYVSGHATFGGAVFGILRLFYGTDTMQFQLQADEYNGITKDSITNQIRPVRARYYQSFTQDEDENFLGRIYVGVHWRTDQDAGRTMGQQIASYIFTQND
ncbi:unnamed protein product [Rotaria socialis]|uniref:Phosphatidic acid phosphatase type 2/haloperoxidase domain-containing protein n=2 Tax=Rotaria socialis TaxID=392032 RepID=A0A817S5B3_9BILA|nr:unnamed protein product [Rotaria socialis]CAF4367900.1 unnamed protein product [Rotaria socialis]